MVAYMCARRVIQRAVYSRVGGGCGLRVEVNSATMYLYTIIANLNYKIIRIKWKLIVVATCGETSSPLNVY